MLDNKPESAGDDYPRWMIVKGEYGSIIKEGWHVMYPVQFDEWRKMGSVEKTEHFVEGMREFVDKYALPMLARWRYPREHPEFKFESWLAEADEAVPAPPDEEGDEEFNPRDYVVEPNLETCARCNASFSARSSVVRTYTPKDVFLHFVYCLGHYTPEGDFEPDQSPDGDVTGCDLRDDSDFCDACGHKIGFGLMEAAPVAPDDEGDEEFDPRAYVLQQPQSGTVVKDSPTLRIMQLDIEDIERRVDAIGHRNTDWERHDAVYLIVPEGYDQVAMGVKSSGDIYVLQTHRLALKKVLHEMPYSRELRRFFRSIANKWIKDGNEEPAMYMFTLLYGPKVVLKYLDRYDMPLSLKLRIGLDLAKSGDYPNAAKLLKVATSRMTPQGAAFAYPDWSALSRFFARPDQSTAESILSGDPVDADWVFDFDHRPKIDDLTGKMGKEDFDIIRETLPHRRICPYGDGQFVLLSSKLLVDFDNADIVSWLDNEDEFDPEGELQDIRDAIIRAACSAMEEANSNAYYEGYKEAVLDGLGASAKMVADKVVLTVPWDNLKTWLDDAGDEPSSLDDLMDDYAPRIEANEDGYSTSRYEDDAFLMALDSELAELDMPEYPYDPDQQMLPGILPPNPHEKVYAHFFSQHYPGGAQVRTTRGELDKIKKTEPWRLDKDQWDAYAAKNDLPPLSPTRPVSEALASALLEEHYSYSSTQLDVTPPQSDFVFEWGRLNIPDENLALSPDNENPRELHQHVTIKYGLTINEAPQELRDLCKGIKPFPVYIGKVSLFRNDEYDVVKLNVESLELRQLNAEISALIPNEDKYPEYTPHLTVAYVKKGTCDALEGMDIFTGKESGVDPQFIAYGLKFCPAGEESTQAEEVILFSRVKKPLPQQELESAGKPESSMESEPFVGLPFPLDPDRVKPFLHAARSKARPLVL